MLEKKIVDVTKSAEMEADVIDLPDDDNVEIVTETIDPTGGRLRYTHRDVESVDEVIDLTDGSKESQGEVASGCGTDATEEDMEVEKIRQNINSPGLKLEDHQDEAQLASVHEILNQDLQETALKEDKIHNKAQPGFSKWSKEWSDIADVSNVEVVSAIKVGASGKVESTIQVENTDQPMRKKDCGKEKDKFMLVNVSAVPEYQAMTAINSGYRQGLDYKDCLLSIFRLHNETINIWTHLLGFLIFSVLVLKDSLWEQEHIRDATDYLTTMLQLFGCQICMLSSALYHTMSCHSSSLSWLCLDQSSILIAVYGTSVKVIVNHFHCFPQQKNLHLVLVTVLSVLSISALFLKKRSLVTGLVSRVIPLVLLLMALHHVFIMAHWVYLGQHLTMSYVLWMCIPYTMAGVGVFFYLSHIPERLCCSEFDIWGASHQIWHVFILTGMASWYWFFCWTSCARNNKCGNGMEFEVFEPKFHNSTLTDFHLKHHQHHQQINTQFS